MIPAGPLAALSSSFTWAFASTRYAQASRDVGAWRVNLIRALTVAPVYAVAALVLHRGHPFEGIDAPSVGWLFISILCSYAFADGMFFTAAKRIGISTALSIASIYPLWAALYGALVRHEAFGSGRFAGTALCIGGVIALVRLSHRKTEKADLVGVALAFATSILWAGNTITVKLGSEHISIAQVNMVRFSIAIALLAVPVWLRPEPAQVSPRVVWRRLLPAIALDAILGSILYVYGLAHTDLAVGATLSSLSPLISVPIAIFLGEEKWSSARFLAVTATVTGVAVLISS